MNDLEPNGTNCQRFIGTKIIYAEPMDLVTFKNQRQEPYEGENAPGYRVIYPDGYISWSPEKAFEDAYRRCDNMNFGLAIEAMRKGEKVARAGWNGKGMYVFLIGIDPTHPGIGGWTYTNGKNDNMPLLPFIAMKTADNKVVPWLASQTDMLAEDWQITA